jgi:hypothetical protein
MLFGVGCSENLHPNTDRTRVCEAVEAWVGITWWVLVVAPAVLFLGSQSLPWFRRHSLLSAISVLLAMSAVWTYLLLVTSSITETSSSCYAHGATPRGFIYCNRQARASQKAHTQDHGAEPQTWTPVA